MALIIGPLFLLLVCTGYRVVVKHMTSSRDSTQSRYTENTQNLPSLSFILDRISQMTTHLIEFKGGDRSSIFTNTLFFFFLICTQRGRARFLNYIRLVHIDYFQIITETDSTARLTYCQTRRKRWTWEVTKCRDNFNFTLCQKKKCRVYKVRSFYFRITHFYLYAMCS